MACFIVPAGEAVVTQVVKKVVEKKELKQSLEKSTEKVSVDELSRIPLARKLQWLTRMLSGGSVLLAFEHVWHGEVMPWFPFLTAAQNSAEITEMLREMATTGVSMAALVTAVWGIMLAVVHVKENHYLEQVKNTAGNNLAVKTVRR